MTKKQWWMLIGGIAVAVLVVAVVLLTLPKSPPADEPSSSVTDAFVPLDGERVTFTATVLNVREGAVLMNVNGALCWVRTTVQSDVPVPSMAIGDTLKVVHNGVVAESYPGQINFVYEIRKLAEDSGKLTYTLTPSVSADKALTQVSERCDLGGAVYLYGLDGLEVTVEQQTMGLQHALAVGVVSPQYLLDQAEADAKAGACKRTEYKDGGSKLYRYDNYAILKMNTIAGDKTLYIGTPDLTPNTV